MWGNQHEYNFTGFDSLICNIFEANSNQIFNSYVIDIFFLILIFFFFAPFFCLFYCFSMTTNEDQKVNEINIEYGKLDGYYKHKCGLTESSLKKRIKESDLIRLNNMDYINDDVFGYDLFNGTLKDFFQNKKQLFESNKIVIDNDIKMNDKNNINGNNNDINNDGMDTEMKDNNGETNNNIMDDNDPEMDMNSNPNT